MAAKRSGDPGSVSGKLPYEELRLKRIEENRKRLKDIGLLENASLFRKRPSKATTPKRTVKRSTFTLEKSVVETRRSPRLTRNPSINYKEPKAVVLEEGSRRSRAVGRVLKRGFVSSAAKTGAASKATEVSTEYPSFVKPMLKSHVSGGFWLGLPHAFCKVHFSDDVLVTLEDEDGLEWETVYLHHKSGLSGGWRGFSLDHGLEDGDALVFELVKPTRFKVHIIRVSAGDPDQEADFGKKSYRYALKENKENEHVNSPLHKTLKREQLKTEVVGFISPKRAKTAKPSRKRKLDLSESSARNYAQVEPKAVEDVSSEDGCPGDACLTTKTCSPGESGRRVRIRVPAGKAVVKSGPQTRKALQNHPTRPLTKDKGVVFTKKVRAKKVAEQNLEFQITRKNAPKLPAGAKIKAVGFCSIAGNCGSARKVPGRTPKYSLVISGKGVTAKVH